MVRIHQGALSHQEVWAKAVPFFLAQGYLRSLCTHPAFAVDVDPLHLHSLIAAKAKYPP